MPTPDTGIAVAYAIRAGDRALAQLAHDEAAAYYHQALELLDVGGGTVETAQRLDLLLALGEAQRRAGDGAYRQTLLDAAGLAARLGDAERLARAALTNNRLGVASVAPDAKLVVAKSLDSSGSGYDDDVAAGIHWVVDHGARVVNLSIGGQTTNISHSGATPFLHDAIEYAWAHGAISVLAAGNYAGLGLGLFSADYGNLDAVVVGATDRNDHVALYSSDLGNAKWTILAPGGSGTLNQQDDILSTYWQAGSHTSYAYMAGTSMATPHVSGALAALIARGFTTAQGAVDRLLASVDALSCGGNSPTCRGRLDVAKAVAQAGPGPTPSTTTPANTTTTRAAPGASRGGGTPAAAPAGPLSTVNVPRLASPAAAAGRSPATTAEGRSSAAGEVGAAAPTNASHKGGSSLPAAALVVAVICLGAAAVALVSRARRDRLGLAATTHRPPG